MIKQKFKKSLLQKIGEWNRARINNRRQRNTKTLPDIANANRFVILTTDHCMHVALLIQDELFRAEKKASIIKSEPHHGFSKDVHIVICPQVFENLPKKYIAFQMEQSTNNRWFTQKYFDILNNAIAILDYSTENIKYLKEQKVDHCKLFFTPIDKRAYPPKDHVEKEYDVLFYGDTNNNRRKEYLEAISKHFNTKIINNLFGEKLQDEINKTKIVINVHYYENALLETTRIYECLSHGATVVSEESIDFIEHTQLKDKVHFVKVGDIDAMIAKIQEALISPKINKIDNDTSRSTIVGNAFRYYFNRFLLAQGVVSFESFYQSVKSEFSTNGQTICLGLPESTERKKSFEQEKVAGISYFPGIRHQKGWIGCGLSYKFLALWAMEHQVETLTVCEDDVEFKEGWRDRLKNATDWLNATPSKWDLFSGLIADLPKHTTILDTTDFNGETYAKINDMTSTVFNIYNRSFLEKLARWDHNNQNPHTNTIDRFLSRTSEIITITTYPFIFGHKEDLDSTLWGFNNKTYLPMIAASEARLLSLIKQFNPGSPLDLANLGDKVAISQDRSLNNPNGPVKPTLSASTDNNLLLWNWIGTNHYFNCKLWAEEDLARRTTVSDTEIAQNKRAIDKYNQARNDATERVDELLLIALGLVDEVSAHTDSPVSVVPEKARLNSETAGSIIDRMSIMALKIHAMRAQTLRNDVDESHRVSSQVKLDRLLQQRSDLGASLDRLISDTLAGLAYFKVYRQFKMYNDPRFNPALVAEQSKAQS